MRRLLTALLLFCVFIQKTRAQSISITTDGSQPLPGAMLDIKSINKGLLIPRLALTGNNDVATLPDRPVSLLIYNTATVAGTNAVDPGYYYWDGAVWTRLINTGTSSFSTWSLGGNAGTSPATHFIGTSDDNSLLFRINNNKAGYIGKGINDGNVFWGYQGGYNNTGYNNIAIGRRALFTNTTLSNLVAVGDSALYNNSLGEFNTAIGTAALLNNTSGTWNTAIGYQALYRNAGTSENTAIGFNALHNNAGTNNTAVGAKALAGNSTGSFNVAVGYNALLSNTSGRKNTAMGHDALAQNTFGQGNVALGTAAMFSNAGGINSVALGEEALRNNTSGGQNTAIGHFSLYTNVSGINNTTLGAFADVQSGNLSNATAVGASSRVGCSNCLVLGAVSVFNPVNVGIGYATPEFPLTFRSNTGDKISLYGTTGSHYGLGIQGGLLQVYTDGASSDIAFGYGQSNPLTENIRMKGNGDLLMGITNANATLIFGQSLSKKIVFFQGGVGQVGMGVFPGELRMYGDFPGASITFGNDNTITGFSENMRIQGNGNLQVRGAVFASSAFYTSDSHFKTNIEPIKDALAKITQLNGYHYTWTDPQQDQSLQSGVLAQEVQQLFPELVKTNEKGYLSVNYVGLVPYLIQSVKEQQKQMDQMQQQIEELMKMIKKSE